MVPLAPKLKVITYHFISYRRKSVLNLVEIQNTFVVLSFWIAASPIKFRDFKTYLDKGYNAYGYARGGMLQDIKNLGRKTETLCHY